MSAVAQIGFIDRLRVDAEHDAAAAEGSIVAIIIAVNVWNSFNRRCWRAAARVGWRRNFHQIIAGNEMVEEIVAAAVSDSSERKAGALIRHRAAIILIAQVDRHARDALFIAIELAIINAAAARAVIPPDAVAEADRRNKAEIYRQIAIIIISVPMLDPCLEIIIVFGFGIRRKVNRIAADAIGA